MQPKTRWWFFWDGVMCGVSTGEVAFLQEDGRTHARMTGRVSTSDRGGFIQMRMELASPPSAATISAISCAYARRAQFCPGSSTWRAST